MVTVGPQKAGPVKISLDGKDIIKALLGDYSSLVGGEAVDSITKAYESTGIQSVVDAVGKVKNIGNTALDAALGSVQDYLSPKNTLNDLLDGLIPKDLQGKKKDDTISQIFGLLRNAKK